MHSRSGFLLGADCSHRCCHPAVLVQFEMHQVPERDDAPCVWCTGAVHG